MTAFYLAEEKALNRLVVLRDMLAEQQFRAEPCPLLMSQLTQAEVLAEKFSQQVREMKRIVAEHERIRKGNT